MVDDLSAPLGQDGKRRRRFVLPKVVLNATAGVLAAIVLGFVLWTLVVEDPLGGEPVVVVSTQPPSKTGGKPEGVARGPNNPEAGDVVGSIGGTASAGSTQLGTQTVTIIDGISGKREQVTIPTGTGGSPKSGVPEGRKNSAAASAPTKMALFDARLADHSRHGTIPKIAADGARASEVFARAPDKTSAGGGPRVAIVVGKLGITANATSEALAKLPAAVTLAFSPYGADLERWVGRARGDGREVLLQVPMEPPDHTDNDPGAQTLLASLPAEQNIDRLHWFMSRFQGYAGIASHMGARFAANEHAVAVVVQEIGKRGLIYFDDGAATQTIAGRTAGAGNMPFAKADVAIDAVPTPADIDGALAKLEALARERGIAVGAAGASSVSIERIARWAKAAAGRGITLVPVSAVAKRGSVVSNQ